MTTKDYKIIAEAIWRAGFIVDKNKIKQKGVWIIVLKGGKCAETKKMN